MPFWKEKHLAEMSSDEWESLCDHCGKCCLMKLADADEDDRVSGFVYYTDIICDQFNKENGMCKDYQNRETLVPNCLRLTPSNLDETAEWLPLSCAYRRIMDGRGLADWHHLVSGDKNTVHQTGNSVLGKVISEKDVDEEVIEDHIVEWPLNEK